MTTRVDTAQTPAGKWEPSIYRGRHRHSPSARGRRRAGPFRASRASLLLAPYSSSHAITRHTAHHAGAQRTRHPVGRRIRPPVSRRRVGVAPSASRGSVSRSMSRIWGRRPLGLRVMSLHRVVMEAGELARAVVGGLVTAWVSGAIGKALDHDAHVRIGIETRQRAHANSSGQTEQVPGQARPIGRAVRSPHAYRRRPLMAPRARRPECTTLHNVERRWAFRALGSEPVWRPGPARDRVRLPCPGTGRPGSRAPVAPGCRDAVPGWPLTIRNGEPLRMPCPRCQRENPSESNFCLGRGARLGLQSSGDQRGQALTSNHFRPDDAKTV